MARKLETVLAQQLRHFQDLSDPVVILEAKKFDLIKDWQAVNTLLKDKGSKKRLFVKPPPSPNVLLGEAFPFRSEDELAMKNIRNPFDSVLFIAKEDVAVPPLDPFLDAMLWHNDLVLRKQGIESVARDVAKPAYEGELGLLKQVSQKLFADYGMGGAEVPEIFLTEYAELLLHHEIGHRRFDEILLDKFDKSKKLQRALACCVGWEIPLYRTIHEIVADRVLLDYVCSMAKPACQRILLMHMRGLLANAGSSNVPPPYALAGLWEGLFLYEYFDICAWRFDTVALAGSVAEFEEFLRELMTTLVQSVADGGDLYSAHSELIDVADRTICTNYLHKAVDGYSSCFDHFKNIMD